MSSSTHFHFHHKVFHAEGGYFASTEAGGGACFHIPMGDVVVAIPLEALRREFGIPADSADGELLGVVERALGYVKAIRIEDAVPNELLDGSASWSVEERHRTSAQTRLALQLVAWATGKRQASLGQELENPAVKRKLRDALGKLAARLGLGDDGAAALEKTVERLAHELSYIEALRERYGAIEAIRAGLGGAERACGQGVLIQEEIGRIRVLLSYAFQKIASQFELLDKQSANVLESLGAAQDHIELVRAARDEIHRELMGWDELLADWQRFRTDGTLEEATVIVKDTYRFLARNYPIVQVW